MDKKPAHEVLIERVKEEASALSSLNLQKFDPSQMNNLTGRLEAYLGVLTRMIIPKNHVDEIVNALREIKGKSCPMVQRLMPESIFSKIMP
ncbi:MAG: hypothetical protein WC385_03655 [Candidatus Paceibacterota bacterium]|jgi:hypothetical protein